MCAQFIIKTNIKKLAKELGIELPPDEGGEWDITILPHMKAPVLIRKSDKLHLVPMTFSLIPSWSKEAKPKFATHNARLISPPAKGATELQPIYAKPTWKKPFLSQHCVIPVSGFVEPIYSGEFAGHMVVFKDPEKHLLFAAGIWDHWVSKETGEIIDSFSIITDDPMKKVSKIGHDRSPVFLPPKFALEWLEKAGDGKGLVDFLRAHKVDSDVTAESFRKMKPGWEKRHQSH